MGARHSKRSLDVTTTPKKEGLSAEGGDAPVVGDGKLERIEEIDAKPATNGVAPHIDTSEEKEVKDKDSATEKEKVKNDEESKEAEETKEDMQAESPTEGGENVTTPTEETLANTTSVSSPEIKESKKKDKPKKKWSFRSISFSKKDKNKPVREETPKNGDVSKEEPLTEGGEEGENATTAVNGTEEKSVAISPTESSAIPVADTKEDEESALLPPSAATATEASSVDDKSEATKTSPSSPIAPTPVPVEAKNDEAEKEEVEKKIVEVSPVQAVAAPVEVTTQTQPIVTPSIIERKTSEDFHSLFPSSPPPTPIDPSPLQQAQQTAANADALAEALKLPAQTIKQSQNDLYISDDQKNSNTIENSSEGAIINQTIVDDKPLDIPDVEENVPELKDYEEGKKDYSTVRLSAITTQTDLVIQTEEGPIPVSSSDTEIDTESEKNNAGKINVEVITEISDSSLEVGKEITNNDHEIVANEERILFDEQSPNAEFHDEINARKIEDDIPPPLPESPVPMPKTTADLLNFMTSQIEDNEDVLNDVIDLNSPLSTECITAAEVLPCAPTVSNKITSEIESPNKVCNISESSNILLPPQDIENLSLPPPEVAAYEVVQESISLQSESPIESLLTPPRSPSPTLKPDHVINECTSLVINSHENNTTVDNEKEKKTSMETRFELVKQNHPVTNNDTINTIKDRLADTIANGEEKATAAMAACPLTQHVENDEQSIVESVAAVENIVADISLPEAIEEATKNAITETPVSPLSKAPMITEDVASVTKVVEEIDINEKAVAAAVNENIECITKNEIIAEMNHQNNLNE